MVIRQVPSPEKSLHAEFKGLTSHVSSRRRTTSSAFVGLLKRDESNLLIPQGLLANLLSRTGGGLLNLKDLLTMVPPSSRVAFSSFVGANEERRGQSIDSKVVVGRIAEENRRSLAQSKGVTSGACAELERLFEKRARFEVSFRCRIASNSTIFRQKRADYRRKSRLFATDFIWFSGVLLKGEHCRTLAT